LQIEQFAVQVDIVSQGREQKAARQHEVRLQFRELRLFGEVVRLAQLIEDGHQIEDVDVSSQDDIG